LGDRFIPEESQQKSVQTVLNECLLPRNEFITYFTIEKFDPIARHQRVKIKSYNKTKDTLTA